MAATPVVDGVSVRPAKQRKDGQVMVPGEELIWEGTTWPCWPCCCFAPMCCSTVSWTVTTKRIDKRYGCCGASEDTLDMRRIADLAYRASPCWTFCCCCRGTCVIEGAGEGYEINTWGTHSLYTKLKEVWSLSRQNVAVDVGHVDVDH